MYAPISPSSDDEFSQKIIQSTGTVVADSDDEEISFNFDAQSLSSMSDDTFPTFYGSKDTEKCPVTSLQINVPKSNTKKKTYKKKQIEKEAKATKTKSLSSSSDNSKRHKLKAAMATSKISRKRKPSKEDSQDESTVQPSPKRSLKKPCILIDSELDGDSDLTQNVSKNDNSKTSIESGSTDCFLSELAGGKTFRRSCHGEEIHDIDTSVSLTEDSSASEFNPHRKSTFGRGNRGRGHRGRGRVQGYQLSGRGRGRGSRRGQGGFRGRRGRGNYNQLQVKEDEMDTQPMPTLDTMPSRLSTKTTDPGPPPAISFISDKKITIPTSDSDQQFQSLPKQMLMKQEKSPSTEKKRLKKSPILQKLASELSSEDSVVFKSSKSDPYAFDADKDIPSTSQKSPRSDNKHKRKRKRTEKSEKYSQELQTKNILRKLKKAQKQVEKSLEAMNIPGDAVSSIIKDLLLKKHNQSLLEGTSDETSDVALSSDAISAFFEEGKKDEKAYTTKKANELCEKSKATLLSTKKKKVPTATLR